MKPVRVGFNSLAGDDQLVVIFLPTLCHRYHHTPKAQFYPDLSAWPRQMAEQQEDYGEDEAAAWYLTKAMAASSLQNSSSTITPSSRVMWSILMPSGSRPSNLFLTSSSLGVKSGMR